MATVLVACAEATPTPNPTPTPTSTPTPTPSPTPFPSLPADLFEGFDATPDPAQLAQLSRLLFLVPADSRGAAFLSIGASVQDPALQRALESQDLGLVSSLPPEISSLLDALVVAVPKDGQGLILILEGAIDIDSLVQWVEGFGVSVVPGTDPAGLVKGSLDTFDDVAPGLLDDPIVALLANNLPSGLTTVLFPDCADLDTVAPNAELSGCNGVGLSAELMAEDTVAVNAVVSFVSEEQASAALPILKESFGPGDLVPLGVAARREGSMVRVRAAVGATAVFQVVGALSLR